MIFLLSFGAGVVGEEQTWEAGIWEEIIPNPRLGIRVISG
jgi:hypothetical protein